MRKNKLKYLVLVVLTVVSLAVVGCQKKESTTSQDSKLIKAGLVYIGYIGEAGWTFMHDEGRKAMETLPFVEKSTVLENVPESADAERSITSLVVKGHNLIFANSYGYMDAMLNVAKKYPDTVFMHCAGYKVNENMGTYFGRIEEARYLTGIVAGKTTKTNSIGYVAAYPIPEVIRGINAFTLGVQSVNPSAVVKVVWTSTWYDPAMERSAAESLLSTGVDIITMHQDTPAIIQAANEKNVMSIGYNSDMSNYAPEYFLTAAIWNWEPYYKHIATQVYEGTWHSSQDRWGMKEGLVDISPFGPKVAEDTRMLVEVIKQDIIDGKLTPFQGPLVDQQGKIRIEAGRAATLEEELTMDYFVKGVQGTLK